MSFQQVYGLNLRNITKPGAGYTPREVLALVKGLPVESAFYSQVRGGPQFIGWNPDRYLLAALVDGVNSLTYAFVQANSKRKAKKPDPVWRPEKSKSDQKSSLFAAMARRAYMAKRK